MSWKHIFAKKDLELLLAEMAGEHRLHRVLGPISLTALGIGCIIGAGIFVMTGRAAAEDAGPAVMVSFAVAAARMCFRRLVLRGIRGDGPGGGQRLHLRLHYARRDFRLDHRLGFDFGIRDGLRHRGFGVGKILERVAFGRKRQHALDSPAIALRSLHARRRLRRDAVVQFAFGADHDFGDDGFGDRDSRKCALERLVGVDQTGGCAFRDRPGWFYVQPANWHSIPYGERILPVEKYLVKLDKEKLAEMAAKHKLDELNIENERTAINPKRK